MFEDRRKRSTLLIATYCEHCGRSTRVTDKGREEVAEAISIANGGIPTDCIKNAFKRLKEQFGYGIPDKKEKNGKNSKVKQSKREQTTELC